MKQENLKVKSIKCYPIKIPVEGGELPKDRYTMEVSELGYYRNRYGEVDMRCKARLTLLVKLETEGGIVGWGECAAIIGPHVVSEIIEEFIEPFVIGRKVSEVRVLYNELYNGMRVRGFLNGFYHDAICAVDIALWDAFGKSQGLPLRELLGGSFADEIDAYPTTSSGKAKEWVEKGFNTIKFLVLKGGEAEGVEAVKNLKKEFGGNLNIFIEGHWTYSVKEAIAVGKALAAAGAMLFEAPCESEDIEGQSRICQAVPCNVAIGEELQTCHLYLPRFLKKAIDVSQPEMGRTGITEFINICSLSNAFNVSVAPHASLGIGVYHAASMQVSAAIPNFLIHECHFGIFDTNHLYLKKPLKCECGKFILPDGPGLGVEVKEEVIEKYLWKKQTNDIRMKL